MNMSTNPDSPMTKPGRAKMAPAKAKPKPAPTQSGGVPADGRPRGVWRHKSPRIHCQYTELRAVDSLRENPKNPNKHSPEQIERIAAVIRRAGWRSPIIVSARSGLIVRGHGRYQAARLAGFKKVPVEVQRYRHEGEEHADMIADNYLAELSALDPTKTRDLLRDLQGDGLEMTGYSEAELSELFAPPKLEKLTVPNPPRMAWALIGVPITQFGKVQALLDKLPPGAKIETTANDQG